MIPKKIDLKFGEKTIEFRLGLGFLGEAFEHTGLDVHEMVEKLNRNPFKMIPELMHMSASYALILRGKEVEYALIDMIDLIDDQPGGINCEQNVKFLKAFMLSVTKDVPKDDLPKNSSGEKKS